jgi:hypothetical protein
LFFFGLHCCFFGISNGSLVLVALVDRLLYSESFFLLSLSFFDVIPLLGVVALVVGPVRMSAFFLFLCCSIFHVHISIVVVFLRTLG